MLNGYGQQLNVQTVSYPNHINPGQVSLSRFAIT